MVVEEIIQEFAGEAAETVSQWDLYDLEFADGIPGAAIISSVVIVVLCVIGTYIARRMYGDL